jgi:multidrug efflux system membrane fusion protein
MVKFLGAGVLFGLFSLPLAAAQWPGVVDWSQRTELSTAVSGVVSQVTVAPGERVKKGQLLLALEQGGLRARLAQHNAEMKYKSLLRDEASKELERAEELYARTLLADHDLNLAKVAYAEADAAYQLSRADVRVAEEALAQSQLKAPFDAWVIARQVQPAETVVSRCQVQPLLTLAAAGRMRVRFSVEAEELAGLAIGQSATVEVAGERFPARVKAIAYEPQSVGGQPRYRAEVEFVVETLLHAGQPATVSVP